MAKTAFSTSNPLTVKVWHEQLYRDVLKETYFEKFMGQDTGSIVQTKQELEKSKGDNVTFGLRMRLTGAGVENSTLEGKEESLTTYSDNVSLTQYRHAVRDDGALSRQRALFDISKESETAIKDWCAEKIDSMCFSALLDDSSPTTVGYIDGGVFKNGTAATAKANLDATDKLEPNFISYIKTLAKTGKDRSFVPVRPVKVGGKEFFVLLVHPDVMYDLKTNSSFQQALREAQVRGDENPLFKNATAIWDGVVIHEHESVTLGTDAGAGSVAYAKCALLGAQSLSWAWGKKPNIIQEDFDYKNEMAYACDFIAGVKRTAFNSNDFGSLGVYVARTQVSDS